MTKKRNKYTRVFRYTITMMPQHSDHLVKVVDGTGTWTDGERLVVWGEGGFVVFETTAPYSVETSFLHDVEEES